MEYKINENIKHSILIQTLMLAQKIQDLDIIYELFNKYRILRTIIKPPYCQNVNCLPGKVK